MMFASYQLAIPIPGLLARNLFPDAPMRGTLCCKCQTGFLGGMPAMTTTNSGTNPGAAASDAGFRFHPKLWIGAAMLVSFPALGAMMGKVNWGPEDFAALGLLLALLCGAIEAAIHFLDAPRWRIGGIMLAVLMFLTVWAHLAVGLFD
jgi:hypothetical protein